MKANRLSRATVAGIALTTLACGSGARAADNIEVMHQWTSGGEAHALQSIKDALASKGVTWSDTAIAGGGGANEKQALQARFASGNPPAATQVQAQDVTAYADQNALGNVNSVAKTLDWPKILSPEVLPYTKQGSDYVAVPIGEHRENMMWINAKLLEKVGGTVPKSWPEFNALADKLKAAGVIPLALGGEDWQEAEVFSDILIGLQGRDFFNQAIAKQDPAALAGPKMVQVFDEFRKALSYTDANRAGRDWNAATQMVITGKAGMQFMGDWAKGEFALANMVPGKDFICSSAPGDGHVFVWEIDEFAFFKQTNPAVQKVQYQLAAVVLDPAVQVAFNMRKGSIPVRSDLDTSKFDSCAQTNFADRVADNKDGNMVGSFIENVAIGSAPRAAIIDVITQFANTPDMTSQVAADKLAKAIKAL